MTPILQPLMALLILSNNLSPGFMFLLSKNGHKFSRERWSYSKVATVRFVSIPLWLINTSQVWRFWRNKKRLMLFMAAEGRYCTVGVFVCLLVCFFPSSSWSWRSVGFVKSFQMSFLFIFFSASEYIYTYTHSERFKDCDFNNKENSLWYPFKVDFERESTRKKIEQFHFDWSQK